MIDDEFLKEIISNPLQISKFNFKIILTILREISRYLQDENILVRLNHLDKNKEILVIGDIHGNLESLLTLINLIREINPEHVIFLGDLVDRGHYQLECLLLVFCLKLLEPKRYYLLRGNHETLEMNRAYGFFNEFLLKYSNFDNYNEILSVYELLPTCLLINEKILCLHGGIPTDLNVLSKINGIKPKDASKEINESLYQMMWNDPKEDLLDFSPSYRGPGIFFFGKEVFVEFMAINHLKYLIRAHECFIEGYKWFFDYRLLSIFSSANYRGRSSSNPASYAIVKNEVITPKNIML